MKQADLLAHLHAVLRVAAPGSFDEAHIRALVDWAERQEGPDIELHDGQQIFGAFVGEPLPEDLRAELAAAASGDIPAALVRVLERRGEHRPLTYTKTVIRRWDPRPRDPAP